MDADFQTFAGTPALQQMLERALRVSMDAEGIDTTRVSFSFEAGSVVVTATGPVGDVADIQSATEANALAISVNGQSLALLSGACIERSRE